MMITAGQKAGTRRRTQRRRVHVVIEEAILGEPVQVGRVDRRAIAPELPKTVVAQSDEQNVRRPRVGPQRLRPSRSGFRDRAPQYTGECASRFVLDEFIAVLGGLLGILFSIASVGFRHCIRLKWRQSPNNEEKLGGLALSIREGMKGVPNIAN